MLTFQKALTGILFLFLTLIFAVVVLSPAQAQTSPSGTTIPPASQIVDGSGNVWTLANTYAVENGVVLTYGSGFNLLFYYNGGIYADTPWGYWYSWSPGDWTRIAGDPSSGGLSASFFGMHQGFFSRNDPAWPSVSVGSLGKGACTAWQYVESPRGTFNWSVLDAKVALAAQHGVDLFYSTDGVPAWALSNQESCAPNYCGFGANQCAQIPDNLADVTNFYAALATRYCGTALKYIELYNEPYQPGENAAPGYFMPASDMATFATYEYNAIRANCPSMQIITPSMAGGQEAYASAYFAAGGPTGVDIASLHAYVDSTNTNCSANAPEGINLGRYLDGTWLQSIISSYVPDKPLWDTEGSFGSDANPCFTTPAAQAAFVSRWYILHWTNNFSRMYWYGWDEPSTGTLDPSMTGSSVPATALQQTENWLIGSSNPVMVVDSAGTVYTVTMTQASGAAAQAVWNTAGSSTYTVPSGYAHYNDLAGNNNAISGRTVTIGIQPILLMP